MTADIRLAFEHPEARAAATAAATPLDRISLRDYAVEVEIGAFQAERGTTQTICFNIVVEVAPLNCPVDDDVDKILSYDRITWAIGHELAAERVNLLETLAERVADRILHEPQARRVFVRIEKLDRGPGALGVEIVRARVADIADDDTEEDAPHPRVVYLSNAAIAAPDLPARLDALSGDGTPLIFCVGLPDTQAPVSDYGPTDRRIALLAIEQNAWVLAARDDRYVVVGTRTELDWAMKNGQTTVWAPSKLVLDAVDGPSVGPQDTLGLALWFATEMQAAEMVTIGAAAPRGPMPTREIALEG
ncbi:Dihydroneopterin aldolase [Candidatus Rhodobacter oscarellae]|uniref:dihydroneopterin aldolase n=1 Tax=Candidatus Rhodobacter oscarellae TaxID=1675527 RepID=A0A0J9E4L0_9RHOB|nr:dihydroneopterin aldolase [Candidatus Rhodobacter lobularis]KMW56764.1 Dihydroneopterin aldolase [Candidatus Rhodobacter lobularis]